MKTHGSRSTLYRSRKGMFGGVCRGFAERYDCSVFWVRVATFLAILFTGFWPVGCLYIVAWVALKQEPVVPFENSAEQEFYESYTTSRRRAVERLKRTFDRLERRIQRMESHVTERAYDWDERLER